MGRDLTRQRPEPVLRAAAPPTGPGSAPPAGDGRDVVARPEMARPGAAADRALLGVGRGGLDQRARTAAGSIPSSGCHCTQGQHAPGSSTASMTPSAAEAVVTRPRPKAAMDWWCEQSTVGAGPNTAAARVPGTVSTSTSPKTKGAPAMEQVADHVGHVLVQRAAELDVEHLAAPADGQHGQVRPQRCRQQRTLAVVAVGVDPAHLGLGTLAVRLRIDVAAAAEHQAVEDGDHLVRRRARTFGRAAGRGQQEGATTGRGHQFEVVLGQDGGPPGPAGPARLGHIRRDADQGNHRGQRTESWTLGGGATNMAPHARPPAHRHRNRRRFRRHRHRCLPRHVRTPRGEAGDRRLLDLCTCRVTRIEACEYLLAVDVDMNPLPGYTFAN